MATLSYFNLKPKDTLQFFKPSSIYYHLFHSPKAKNLNVTNKKVLITGGNKGIGQATVLKLAELGCTDITILNRDEKSGLETIRLAKEVSPRRNQGEESTLGRDGTYYQIEKMAKMIKKMHIFGLFLEYTGTPNGKLTLTLILNHFKNILEA